MVLARGEHGTTAGVFCQRAQAGMGATSKQMLGRVFLLLCAVCRLPLEERYWA